jgi:GNAT superfamily N-acetyltransferase
MRSAPCNGFPQAQSLSHQIVIRPLTPDDVPSYRALRQHILDVGDGRSFSDSYIRERQLENESAWRKWCTDMPDHCIFGTFDGDRLIGIMMVTEYEAFDGRAVEWEAVWLDPTYRRLGIARQAYQKAQRWTEQHGYRYVLGFIRTDNLRAREIFERLGGRYHSTKHDEIWADGSIGDLHTFVLDLHHLRLQSPQRKAIRHLEATNELLSAAQLDSALI